MFVGRDEETAELLSLLICEGVVLFTATSGAGKTSLVNARLIPELEKQEFEVLPVARVGGELPPNLTTPIANVFVYSALSCFSSTQRISEELKFASLKQHLATQTEDTPGELSRRPRVLIFDQFEEIFTTHPTHHTHREDFFRQLSELLKADPRISVLFVAREDYAPRLEKYKRYLPDHRLGVFHMEQLSLEDALQAVRVPAEQGGRPFAPQGAEELVNNLARIQLEGPEKTGIGEYVEPVQLQVVCFQLWEDLQRSRPYGETISLDDVREFGNPTKALELFYDNAIERVSKKTGIMEFTIRRWFTDTLITSARIRAQVLKDKTSAGKLPLEAVKLLVDEHLVRAERARGGTWYELIHDRFIEPVLASNERALPTTRKDLHLAAKAWDAGGRKETDLFYGNKLTQARSWADSNPDGLSAIDRIFLLESINCEARYYNRLKKRAIALGVLLAVSTMLAVFTALLWHSAKAQNRIYAIRELTMAANTQLTVDPERSLLIALRAGQMSYDASGSLIPETKDALNRALQASRIRLTIGNGGIERSLAQYLAFSPDGQDIATVDGKGVLRAWDAVAGKVRGERRSADGLRSVAFQPRGTLLAAGSASGKVYLFDRHTLDVKSSLPAQRGGVSAVTFSSDGRLLAIVALNYLVVWDVAAGRLTAKIAHPGPILAVAFGSQKDRALVATGADDGIIRLFQAQTGRRQRELSGHTDAVLSLAFAPDGSWLTSGSRDSTARVWELEDRNMTSWQLSLSQADPVTAVAFGAVRHHVATVQGRVAVIWNAITGQPLATMSESNAYPTALAFSPDGQRLAITSDNGVTRIYNAGLPETESASFAVLTPDGTRIATAKPGGDLVTVWDADMQEKSVFINVSNVRTAAFSKDRRRIAVSDRYAVKLWSIGISEHLRDFPYPHAQMIALSHDGNRIAVAGTQGARIWDADSKKDISPTDIVGRSAAVARKSIDAIALSGNGRYFAMGSDGSVEVYDLQSNTRLIKYEHGGKLRAVRFTQDGGGAMLASLNADGLIQIRETRSGRLLHSLECACGSVADGMFNPAGNRIAAVSQKGIKIWDINRGVSIGIFAGTSIPVAAAFSASGSRVTTVAADGSISSIELDDITLLGLALRRTTRTLDPDECMFFLHELRGCPSDVSDLADIVNAHKISRAGDLEGATHMLARKRLDPKLWNAISPNRVRADTLLEKGRLAIQYEEANEALTYFKEAQNVDRNLGVRSPHAVLTLLRMSEGAARSGHIKRSIEAYELAQSLNPKQFEDDKQTLAMYLNTVCWYGSAWGNARDVLQYCNQATTLWPENKLIIDSRGLARACSGDVQGAISDFEAFIAWSADQKDKSQRTQWVQVLRRGQSICTPTALSHLR